MKATDKRKERPEPPNVIRARAQKKIMDERDALVTEGKATPVVILAARYDVWPTTIQRWLDQSRWPTLEQARRILEVKP